jgi:hypothetical protein
MFKKAFLILSASAILATGAFAPTSTLAQLPGPLLSLGLRAPLPGSVALLLNSVWVVFLVPLALVALLLARSSANV